MKIKPGLISDWFSDNELINIKIKTHEMYIGTKDDCNNNICKSRSIPSIMAELGHTHIDILKVRHKSVMLHSIIFYDIMFNTN